MERNKLPRCLVRTRALATRSSANSISSLPWAAINCTVWIVQYTYVAGIESRKPTPEPIRKLRLGVITISLQHLLQFLPDSQFDQMYASDGIRDYGSRLDDQGI